MACALPVLANAQESAAAPAAPAANSAMPDVVRLKNGGIVRGTISELVPGDKVVLITPTGEVRTYPMVEVEYAGAANAETPAPAPAQAPAPAPTAAPAPAAAASSSGGETRPFITVHSGEARLHLVAEKDDLTFHVRTGTATATGWSGSGSYAVRADAYSEICTAPCDASLPNGTHVLALSRDGGTPVAAEPIRVEGPTTLHGKYTDRTGVRVGGWVIFLGGLAGGTALMLSSVGDEGGIGGSFYAGVALAGVGTIVGVIMAMTGDKAVIEKRAPL